MAIEYKIRTAELLKLPDQHYDLLVSIIKEAWGNEFAPKGRAGMQKRFDTGNLFIVAYDGPTAEDKLHVYNSIGEVIGTEKIPVGILETIAIQTLGHKTKVGDYSTLTNKGSWKTIPANADTLILVDVTLLHSRRGDICKKQGRKAKGEAKQIITYAKKLLPQTPYLHAWTYTPDIPGVKRWHEKNGASDTGFKIADARPGCFSTNVNMMDYSKFL